MGCERKALNLRLQPGRAAVEGDGEAGHVDLDHRPVPGALLAAADTLNPDTEGGCVLLGVGGICMIAHGSSNARAIESATRRAAENVEARVLERVKEAIARAG